MKFLFLILLLVQYIDAKFDRIVQTATLSCNADFCDPNWTPFENMVYALRGYDLSQGNPAAKNFDPGFKSQIFVPTVLDEATHRYSLASGISANDLDICERELGSKSFSNFQSYSKHVSKTVRSGMDLQIGVERDVSVGVSIEAVEASSSATIPPPFTRGWSNSEKMNDIKSFFSEKQGMISTAKGICLSYEIRLVQYRYPPLTPGFKSAIAKLYEAAGKSRSEQKTVFKSFMREYGTHFLSHSILGAEFIHETKYSGNVRQKFNVDTLESCNDVKGSKIFGIQVEKDSSDCSSSDKKKLSRMSREDIEEKVITRGSRPTDIKNWATQDFKPIPIQFTLSPIVNLFTDNIFKRNNIQASNNEKITNSLKIREWFLPLYWKYCEVMGVECKAGTGCGMDDDCPIDAICTPGGTKHECTRWSSWQCTSKCSGEEKRTRQCNGCNGDTEQVRSAKRCKQSSCFPEKILKFNGLWGNWAHWSDCPAGNYVVRFQTKVEKYSDDNDDTSLNGVEMTCNDDKHTKISSGQGNWGSWHQESNPCPGGFTRAKFKKEPYQGSGDDTGGNAIRLYCQEASSWFESGEEKYGQWSRIQECPKGYRIAGLKTQIEPHQTDGSEDDTAMNGVQLRCKYFEKDDKK